jgi:hypothetical protein
MRFDKYIRSQKIILRGTRVHGNGMCWETGLAYHENSDSPIYSLSLPTQDLNNQ